MLIRKICKECGNEFEIPHWREKTALYCCRACSDKAKHGKPNVKCDYCGKEFHRKQSAINRYQRVFGNFCCIECSSKFRETAMLGENNHQFGLKGELNASFKGQEILHKNHNLQEILVYMPSHPYADKNGRIKKHRLIVEENYSNFDPKYFIIDKDVAYLKPEYHIHHIDGNHNNNILNNLQIVTKSEHTNIHNKNKVIIRDNLGRITAVFKREELLENPEEDNQQPSQELTILEGSETND